MMYRKLFFLLVFLSLSIATFAQKLNSEDFHTHRRGLKNSFLKFQNDKKGRVVFLGGSITHNPGWRDSVCSYLQQKFPETEFDFINAGIPSMGSTPGAFRFTRDVLAHGPVDLLFEEAAVNDDTNRRTPAEIIRGMEGIVRHAFNANPACDLIIMHFVDPGKMDNYRAEKVPEVIQLHEAMAKHYDISTINLAKEVTKRIDAGEFSWENDFKNLHPSPFGQNIYYQSMKIFLENEFNKDYSGKKITEVEIPQTIDMDCYDNGVLVESNPSKSIKGWEMVKNWQPTDGKNTRANYVNVPMFVGNYPGETVKFHFKGNAVGIAVAAGPDAGIIEYSVDNKPWEKQDLFTQWSEVLHLPWYYTLASGLKSGRHTLQLRISGDKNENSTGNVCRIRYFYFNRK